MPSHLDIKLLIIDALNAHPLRPEDIDDGGCLFENPQLGLDSVDCLEISVALRQRYGVRVDNMNLARRVLYSVDTIVQFVADERPRA